MSDIFISYAREDLVFVRHLCHTLQDHDREVWVDLDGVYAGEEFWPKICSGIESADMFAFVISGHSVESEYCRRELEHALEHNKRIVPLIRNEVMKEQIPQPMDQRQWIFFREQDDFNSSVQLLTHALDTDIEWVRSHSRLLVRAREWQQKNKKSDYVLRGNDLKEAEDWLSLAAGHEQKPTLLQSEYITASRKVAVKRLRTIMGAVTAGFVVAVVLAIFAQIQRQNAIEQRGIAENREKIALARKLAVQSEFTRDQHPNKLPHSVRLAIESTRRFNSVEAEQPLRLALKILPSEVTQKAHREHVLDIIFSPNGEYIATRMRDTHRAGEPILVWNASSGEEIARFEGRDRWVDLEFSQDGQLLNTASPEAAVVWDIASGKEVSRINHNGNSWGFYSKPAVFSNGATYLASLQGSVVVVWDIISNKEIKRFSHGDKVETAIFSRDGIYLATVSHDKTATVWEVITGRKVFRVEFEIKSTAFARILSPILFSKKSRYFATASGNSARVYGVPKGVEITNIPHSGQVSEIAFSEDERYIATSGGDNAARIWEVKNGKQVKILYHNDYVNSVAFSPNGRYFATGSKDGTGRLWNIKGQEVLRMSHKNSVHKVFFSPDGSRLATADENHTARVWKVEKGPGEVRISPFRVSNLRVSSGGRYLATVVRMFSDRNVLICEVTKGKHVASINPGVRVDISDFIFSPDGRLLATAVRWVAKVWDVVENKIIATIIHQGNIDYIAFSPDGQYLATAADDNTIYVWESLSGQEIFRKGYQAPVSSLQFTLDGKHIVAIQDSNTLRILEMQRRREVASITHRNPIIRIALSPDGLYLGTATDDGFVWIYEVMGGKLITRFYTGTNVSTLTFTKDGGRLAAAADDQFLKVWDISSGREIQRFNFKGKSVLFSPDGKYLVTVTQPNIRIWDVNNGREIARMNNGTTVNALLFASHGKYLVSASNGSDGDIHSWLWHPENLIQEACRRLTRNFTYEEWLQHLGDETYNKTCPDLPVHPTFIKAARKLARSGDIETAIVRFNRALELNHELGFDPKAEAHRLAALGLVERGRKLGTQGDIEAAVATFKRALQLDPGIGIDPVEERRKLVKAAGRRMVQKGYQFIKAGNIEEAISAFQKAMEYDPDLGIDPGKEVQKYAKTATSGLVKRARNLAEDGDVESAIKLFQEALVYDKNLGIKPRNEAIKCRINGLIEKAGNLAYRGKVKEALAAYKKAQVLDPTLKFSCATWNHLCWNGCLFGHAAQAIEICEKAVALSHEKRELTVLSRRSRGIARAMTGDLQGATEDFNAILELEKNEERKSKYQKWIEILITGKDPFTPDELERLLYWKIPNKG